MMADEKCINKNPLNLSGTAQQDRLAHYLDPKQVSIDGKSYEDYKRILIDLAKITQYYNTSNQRDGDWENFFSDAHFNNDNPNIALFNCFVELMQYAQNDINKITAKHLEFYYEKVLQLARKSETPDQAHILMTLANNIDNHLIEKGTLLKAGKDEAGNDRYYKTKDEIVVNKATIGSLKSIFLEKNQQGVTRVYAADKANSKDGNGADLDEDNPKWAAFGMAQENRTQKTMSEANIGFAIASNFLLLKEGKRVVRVKLNMSSTHGIAEDFLDENDFQLLFSGAEEWIAGRFLTEAEDEEKGIMITENTIQFNMEIPVSAKPVVGYQEEVYKERLNTNSPVFKLLINQSDSKEIYKELTGQDIASITIDVEVKGIKDLTLQNETGLLDPSKPFEVFSAIPSIGSAFYIGSQEVFSKPLTKLEFEFDWQDRPSNMAAHYEGYDSAPANDDFLVEFKALRGRAWNEHLDGNDLNFKFLKEEMKTISMESPGESFPDLIDVDNYSTYTNQAENGFVKMTLTAPDETNFKAFGHGQYQNVYVKKAIQLALEKGVTLPNEPYTPKCKALQVHYEASLTISMNTERSLEDATAHFFHIAPFGAKIQLKSGTPILPVFDFQGGFFIGLEDVELPQNINLLLQVAEGSENPDKLPPEITWSYLANNEWVPFDATEVLTDQTNGVINSGIISLTLPKIMTSNNSLLTDGMLWIAGTIQEDTDAVCQLVDIHTQAIAVAFENADNDLSHLEEALPANTITRLDDSNAAIRKVEQPYASFGGKLPESENNYYRRVSERLRHKNRAITIWDFERLILEEYPSVYKVKCLNHTRMNENYSEQAPGHISLVVVSNLRNQNAVNPLQPTTSLATLQSIQSFLSQVKNPFTTLHVKNPFFEEIQLEFNVRFLPGKDEGFYQKEIIKDIKRNLSPWAYSDSVDITFEGVIYKSKLIDFIEELHYVDYVTCFKTYHFVEGVQNGNDQDEIRTTKSSAILVSHTQHIINVLNTDDCSCGDENTTAVHITDGIGTMTVGLDLEVDKP